MYDLYLKHNQCEVKYSVSHLRGGSAFQQLNALFFNCVLVEKVAIGDWDLPYKIHNTGKRISWSLSTKKGLNISALANKL